MSDEVWSGVVLTPDEQAALDAVNPSVCVRSGHFVVGDKGPFKAHDATPSLAEALRVREDVIAESRRVVDPRENTRGEQ